LCCIFHERALFFGGSLNEPLENTFFVCVFSSTNRAHSQGAAQHHQQQSDFFSPRGILRELGCAATDVSSLFLDVSKNDTPPTTSHITHLTCVPEISTPTR
jgi:hypothetical protein